jgi:hypothetical protein
MRILIPFSHCIRILHFFALFRIFALFFAYLARFSRTFHNFLVKYWPTRWKKYENNAKKVQKVRCECEMQMRCKNSAMRWALIKSANANAMRKSFRTTIPVRDHDGQICKNEKSGIECTVFTTGTWSFARGLKGLELGSSSSRSTFFWGLERCLARLDWCSNRGLADQEQDLAGLVQFFGEIWTWFKHVWTRVSTRIPSPNFKAKFKRQYPKTRPLKD